MTDAELMEIVKKALFSVAPDLEGEPFDPERTFQDQFEIDSMDFLNFVIALNKLTGIEIAEGDYSEVQTPSGAVAFLRARSPRASA
jgi:acyl carrier protein